MYFIYIYKMSSSQICFVSAGKMSIKITDKAISVLNAEYALWKNILSGVTNDYDEDLKAELEKADEAAEEKFWQQKYKLYGISYVRNAQYKQYKKELYAAKFEKYPFD